MGARGVAGVLRAAFPAARRHNMVLLVDAHVIWCDPLSQPFLKTWWPSLSSAEARRGESGRTEATRPVFYRQV